MSEQRKIGPYRLVSFQVDVLNGTANVSFGSEDSNIFLNNLKIGDIKHLNGQQAEYHALDKAREQLLNLAHHIEHHPRKL